MSQIPLRACGLALAWLTAHPTSGASQPIVEFPTPTGPNAIASGPDSLYFTTFDGRLIGRIATDGSVVLFEEILPPCGPGPLTGSETLAFGNDGNLWITPDCGGGVGGRPPAMGTVVAKMTLEGSVLGNSVVASLPTDMILGPDGNMWISGDAYGAIPIHGGIWRITGTFVANRFEIAPSGGTAMGLAAGHDGNIWFTEEGNPRIGKMSTSGVVTLFDLPSQDRSPFFITSGPDGNLWFTESSLDGLQSWIGRATLSGEVTEFPLTTQSPLGFARITSGADGNVWFTEPGYFSTPLAKIGRITPEGLITEFATPTPNSRPTGIAAGPDGNIWFTEPAQHKIGRVNLNQADGCSPTPIALCLQDGRFRVESQWRRPTDSAPSAGHAVSLTQDTGYFWFFDASNVEVVTKVLNGCPIDGSYWFFAGGLTNVEVTLTVTDEQTNAVKTYTSTQGTPFLPIQDTTAFSTCP